MGFIKTSKYLSTDIHLNPFLMLWDIQRRNNNCRMIQTFAITSNLNELTTIENLKLFDIRVLCSMGDIEIAVQIKVIYLK